MMNTQLFQLSKSSHHFPTNAKTFLSVLPKIVYQVPLRKYSISSQTKPAKHVKTSRDKSQNKLRLLFLKTITWKQRRDVLASEGFTTHKRHYNSRH